MKTTRSVLKLCLCTSDNRGHEGHSARPGCPLCYRTCGVKGRLSHKHGRGYKQRQTKRQRERQRIRVLLGLNGWYTGLEIRLFHVSRDRLRLTSYAAFLTRSSASSRSLSCLSICACPSCSILRLPLAGHVLHECPGRIQTQKI